MAKNHDLVIRMMICVQLHLLRISNNMLQTKLIYKNNN